MDWIKESLKKIVFSILGIAVMLAWWSWRGPSSDPNRTQSKNEIPAQFWEGGPNQISVSATTTVAGPFRLSLSGPLADNPEEERWHQAWVEVDPGTHNWNVNFPNGITGGIVELGANDPKVGDKIDWEVKLNGQVIQQDSYTLDKPLQEGYAMFLQVELEEFLAGPQSGQEGP